MVFKNLGTVSTLDLSVDRCYLIDAASDSRRDVLTRLSSPLCQGLQGLFGVAGRQVVAAVDGC